jgi:Mg-chelatase subunit ChlD/tetratricopeptide (TPR) repeat protein
VAAAPIEARLELAAGEVTLEVSGKQGEQRAVSGTALFAETRVKTAPGARALVRLPDGSAVFLRGGSKALLGTQSVTLDSGEYWLEAPPHDREPMLHQAGGVSVSAVDSALSVRREADKVTVYVARGMAVVSAKSGRVEVNAGEQATVPTDGKPDAKPAVTPVAFWNDWTGGMADSTSARGLPGAGSGAIYGVDVGAAAGSPARRLEVSRQAIRAVLRDGLSETRVDQTFFNPGERDVEGWYWFTIPEIASVTGFAVETNGVLVDGEFIEKRTAAAQYAQAVDRGHAPAILEYVDGKTYRARIHPVPAGGTRRVVLRYVELHSTAQRRLSYVYPMGSGEPVRIGEFSLTVDLGDRGQQMRLSTLADARVESGGKLVTMRRSGYTPRAPFQLEADVPSEEPPLTVARHRAGGDSADYVMVRYRPDIDWSAAPKARADVVVVVDTSAAGDETARQLKTATAEAVLRSLSDEDRFALVSLDVRPKVLYPEQALATASEKEIQTSLEKLAAHSSGGATDLAATFDVALARLHEAAQPAIVYIGDGIATSGELLPEQLVERLRRALGTSRARLFTLSVGTDAAHSLQSELARVGGGIHRTIDDLEQTTSRALELAAAIKLPTVTELSLDLGAGLDEPFYSATGKLPQGSELTVLARTHHDLPARVKVRGSLAGKAFEREYAVKQDTGVVASYVPRLWAAEQVRRLLGSGQGAENERGRIAAIGVEYGLMTPYTSILALESEAAYSNMGIQRRRSPLRGVELGALMPLPGRRPAGVALATFGCESQEAAPSAAEKAMAPMPAAPRREAHDEAVPPPAQAEPMPSEELSAATSGADFGAIGPLGGGAAPAPAPEYKSSPSGYGIGAARGGAPRPSIARAKARRDLDEETGKGEGAKAAEAPRGSPSFPLSNLKPLVLTTCSDSASRPLAQRVLLWRARLRAADGASALLARYEAALRACELNDWRAERTFLDLMQSRLASEGDVRVVLAGFAERPDVQKFVGKLILRRTVDTRVVAAVEKALFGGAVDWNALDLKLQALTSPDERITLIREQMAKAPEDPAGAIRLVRELVEAGKPEEAVALGRRLRDQGFVTPRIARELGDVLAKSGLEDDAVRTYSEIVEFDPESIASRQLLGDIYLGHGWYEPAYRQYRTIADRSDDPLSALRLAAAASGAGRIDEALRIERRIATAEGRPGPTDPRRFARFWSAARLARLLHAAKTGQGGSLEAEVSSMKRKLQELGVWSGPATLVVLTWEELDAELLLVTRSGGRDTNLGDVVDAAVVGLSAVLLPNPELERLAFAARLRSTPRSKALRVMRQDIVYDGKDFTAKVAEATLEPRQTELSL